MGRPSANLTYDIKVRVDDKLNTKIEKYAIKCNLSKAAAIREILSSFFAQKKLKKEITATVHRPKRVVTVTV